jgi:hypothetical protein
MYESLGSKAMTKWLNKRDGVDPKAHDFTDMVQCTSKKAEYSAVFLSIALKNR